jgi:hypothetical protein
MMIMNNELEEQVSVAHFSTLLASAPQELMKNTDQKQDKWA